MQIQTYLGVLFINLIVVSGCSFSSQPMLTSSEPQPKAEVAEADIPVAEAGAETSEVRVDTTNYWQEALDTGMSAAVLAQTAKFPNDWELVASRWQRAIASLQAIPESDAQYQTAQTKIDEYQRNLQVAQQHAQTGTVSRAAASATATPTGSSSFSASPTSPASSGPSSSPSSRETVPINAEASQFCQGAAAKSDGQPYGLSRLQWHQSPFIDPFSFDAFEPSQLEGTVFLIGCVTNNSSQPLTAPYLWGVFPNTNSSGGMLFTPAIPSDMIQPGQVVPFSALVNQPLSSLSPSSADGSSSHTKIDDPFPADAIASAQAKVAEAKRYCNGVTPSKPNQPFEVNKLQIRVPTYDPFDFGKSPDEGYLIGCITNHSNQPITTIMVSYTFNVRISDTSNSYGFSAGSLHLPVKAIQPGETMVFREMGSFSTTERPTITVEGFTSDVGDIEVNTPLTR